MATNSVEKLNRLVDRALRDDAWAEKLFSQPDAIATEYGLSADEKLVVKQMNRERFEAARRDAAARAGSGQLADRDLERVAGGGGASLALGTAARMILGRSINSAAGGSYGNLAGAGCECCKWKGGISMGDLVLPADR